MLFVYNPSPKVFHMCDCIRDQYNILHHTIQPNFVMALHHYLKNKSNSSKRNRQYYPSLIPVMHIGSGQPKLNQCTPYLLLIWFSWSATWSHIFSSAKKKCSGGWGLTTISREERKKWGRGKWSNTNITWLLPMTLLKIMLILLSPKFSAKINSQTTND